MSTWRLFILLSPQRGTLGREFKGYTFSSLGNAMVHADSRIPALDLRALDSDTGNYADRIRGRWGQPEIAKPAPLPSSPPPSSKPAPPRVLTEEERKRLYWMDTDGGAD